MKITSVQWLSLRALNTNLTEQLRMTKFVNLDEKLSTDIRHLRGDNSFVHMLTEQEWDDSYANWCELVYPLHPADKLASVMWGRTRGEVAMTQTCVMCGEDASVFKDAISRKEYGISRLCQKCQDEVFSC